MDGRHGLCVVGAVVCVALLLGGCAGRREAPSVVSSGTEPPNSAASASTAPDPSGVVTDGVRAPETAEAMAPEVVMPGQRTSSPGKQSAGNSGRPKAVIAPPPQEPRDETTPQEGGSLGEPDALESAAAGTTEAGSASPDDAARPIAEARETTSGDAAVVDPGNACQSGCGPLGCAPPNNGLPAWGALQDGAGGMLSR